MTQQHNTPRVPEPPRGDKAAKEEAERLQTTMDNVREGYGRPRGGDDANGNAVETDSQRAQRGDKA